MANALTGDFDVVAQFSTGAINRILAAIAPFGAVPHSLTLRVDDTLGPRPNWDATETIHPLARKFDQEQAVHVDSSGQLTINFQVYQEVGGGTFPFINAIEVKK